MKILTDTVSFSPELRLQDFDDYISLMNGQDAETIFKFMKELRPFNEYCDLVRKYHDTEMKISVNVWGVISMGLYEFHRTGLIATLEMLARYMQTELLKKMVGDQQNDMAQLQAEYEEICEKSLSIPEDTAKLMESKAYVLKTEADVIPVMENRLRVVSFRIV